MQDTYFNTCTEKAKQGLDMPEFGENSFFNCEPEYNAAQNQDLSLKLRGKLTLQTPYCAKI